MEPTINIIKHEETPKNRKDMVLMSAKAIRDSHNIDDLISAHINFINIAMPEIPDKTYPRSRIYDLEPNLDDTINEYTKQMNFIIPEQIQRHMGYVMIIHKNRYLRRLQKERGIIEDLLKKHTNWYFDDNKTLTMG